MMPSNPWDLTAGIRSLGSASRTTDGSCALAKTPLSSSRRCLSGSSRTSRPRNASGTTNLKIGAEREYSVYLADILEHFYRNPDDAGQQTFNYVRPVNEPQWDWSGHSQEGS